MTTITLSNSGKLTSATILNRADLRVSVPAYKAAWLGIELTGPHLGASSLLLTFAAPVASHVLDALSTARQTVLTEGSRLDRTRFLRQLPLTSGQTLEIGASGQGVVLTLRSPMDYLSPTDGPVQVVLGPSDADKVATLSRLSMEEYLPDASERSLNTLALASSNA